MKKIISLALTFAGLVGLVGCDEYTPISEDGSFEIVCTIFPVYDWVSEITAGNENVNVTFLMDNGIDLHNYQPSISDIATIQSADLFVYVGGDSDTWVKDVTNKNQNTFDLVDKLGKMVLAQVEVEGMQSDDSHSHSSWFPHSHDDEHVWLSLLNAKALVNELAVTLSTIDVANSELYLENAELYTEKLSALNEEYVIATENPTNKTLVFADRFPFLYMMSDYNLEYYAAFSGCSSELEVSFETIKFLVDKIDELGLENISAIEGSTNDISKTVNENLRSEQKGVLIFNSMQSITKNEVNEGVSYLSLMEYNLEMLKIALEN